MHCSYGMMHSDRSTLCLYVHIFSFFCIEFLEICKINTFEKLSFYILFFIKHNDLCIYTHQLRYDAIGPVHFEN